MPARTPSQTIGPFFSEALRWRDGHIVRFAESGGTRVRIDGRILDGEGRPVPDALVETWQASPSGAVCGASAGEANPHGFGRVNTDRDGAFHIETAMPGSNAAAWLEVTILARGLLKALRTRVYLAAVDRVREEAALAAIAASPRIETLVAQPAGDHRYRWDVRLQGDGETVFFG